MSDPVDGDNLLNASTLGVDGVAHIDDSPSWQRALDVVVHSCAVLRQASADLQEFVHACGII